MCWVVEVSPDIVGCNDCEAQKRIVWDYYRVAVLVNCRDCDFARVYVSNRIWAECDAKS